MDDDLEVGRTRLLISARWPEETAHVSLAAQGLLSTLIQMAAAAGTAEIPVSPGNMGPHVRHSSDRERFPVLLAELRLAGLLRPVRPGVFSVAPGLWKVGVWYPGDGGFVPLT